MTRARATAVALVLGAAALAGCGGGGEATYALTIYFPRAVALYEGGDVRVLGLPAGRVEEIVVEGTRVRVDVEMEESVKLPTDARAVLIPQSLIGERYIQLTPAWTVDDGQTLAELPEDERVIVDDGDDANGREVTVPVEPDEALAAVNDFVRALDPEGLGRLIDNLATGLDGNGEQLGVALSSISELVETFADRDQELAAIVDNFDEFTTMLVTREAQIGTVLDSFAGTARVLAEERESLEALLAGLADVSVQSFDLVAEHATALRTDLATLARLGQSIDANLDAVVELVQSGPLLAAGLENAYDPVLNAMTLRTQLGPLAQQILNPVLRFLLGDPTFNLPCIPIDTACDDPLLGLGTSAPVPTAVEAAPAATPIDAIVTALGSPTATIEAGSVPGAGDRVVEGAGSVGSFLRDAAETLVGVGG